MQQIEEQIELEIVDDSRTAEIQKQEELKRNVVNSEVLEILKDENFGDESFIKSNN